MTTEKQIIANKQNAQMSTGPKSVSGKKMISKNATKHGIFTNDLILSSDIENENKEEYQEIFNNLVQCLLPENQLESLLVEKIAADFWRLRRTIRFETGSIAQSIKSLIREFYSYGKKNNDEIDKEIEQKKRIIFWNLSYIECLSEYKVSFDKAEWNGNDIKSDITEDFYLIAKSITSLTNDEQERIYCSFDLTFEELRDLIEKYGYSDTKKISDTLVEILSKQNETWIGNSCGVEFFHSLFNTG